MARPTPFISVLVLTLVLTLPACSQNSADVLEPVEGKIYFGAFPDFGGAEENVSVERVTAFEALAGRKLFWAYFSQNWGTNMSYPRTAIHALDSIGCVPFIRFMPRRSLEEYRAEDEFSLQRIIDGAFDEELRAWARAAREDGIPLLIDFAPEMNGEWFGWSGVFSGGGATSAYGDPRLPDGPERYRDAYRHLIMLFREEGATHITWFFHPNLESVPDEPWNQPAQYYPGDEFIDWVGVSAYGALTPEEDWVLLSELLAKRRSAIEFGKPLALLEFGVTDHHPAGSKRAWIDDAFAAIMQNSFSAVAYWHENWEEENTTATLRIDSSPESLAAFRRLACQDSFIPACEDPENARQAGGHAGGESEPRTQAKSEPERDQRAAAQAGGADNTESKLENSEEPTWYQPRPGVSWQWQLTGPLNTGYDVELYDIDLDTPAEQIAQLHAAGRKVICYFNAGAYEPYRRDAGDFPRTVLGRPLEGWEDERWLDIAHYERFADIMKARLDAAAAKGCDGVEPDNIDAYEAETGFPLTAADQLRYNRWLAGEAHRRGLAIALKNDLGQVEELVDDFDFAINEECFFYDECEQLLPFIAQGKAVLGVEYEDADVCARARAMNFSWLLMDLELAGGRQSCEGFTQEGARPDSNWGPSPCRGDVIATRLRARDRGGTRRCF